MTYLQVYSLVLVPWLLGLALLSAGAVRIVATTHDHQTKRDVALIYSVTAVPITVALIATIAIIEATR